MAITPGQAQIITDPKPVLGLGVAWSPQLQLIAFDRSPGTPIDLDPSQWTEIAKESPDRMGLSIVFTKPPRTIALRNEQSDDLMTLLEWPDPRPLVIMSSQFPLSPQCSWFALGGAGTQIIVTEFTQAYSLMPK